MRRDDKVKMAQLLYDAGEAGVPIAKFSLNYPEMTMDDAYEIQQMILEKRLEAGARSVGKKIGLTSKAMQQTLNVEEPAYAPLLDTMVIDEGTACSTDTLIAPRVEGEIAFILKEALKGPGVTVADVYNATAWVVPCFEICDSRFENWSGAILDSVSDNVSGASFVLGSKPKHISEVNLRLIGMVMEKNGVMVGSAAGAEVMGNPAAAVAWLANKMSRNGQSLEAGNIVLSGSFMKAMPAEKGDVFCVSVDGFPTVTLRFE